MTITRSASTGSRWCTLIVCALNPSGHNIPGVRRPWFARGSRPGLAGLALRRPRLAPACRWASDPGRSGVPVPPVAPSGPGGPCGRPRRRYRRLRRCHRVRRRPPVRLDPMARHPRRSRRPDWPRRAGRTGCPGGPTSPGGPTGPARPVRQVTRVDLPRPAVLEVQADRPPRWWSSASCPRQRRHERSGQRADCQHAADRGDGDRALTDGHRHGGAPPARSVPRGPQTYHALPAMKPIRAPMIVLRMSVSALTSVLRSSSGWTIASRSATSWTPTASRRRSGRR